MKYWNGSRVEAEGRMARRERSASSSGSCRITTERRSQPLFCLAPSTVASILTSACVARLAEIAADIDTALRALAKAKFHCNETYSIISTGSLALDFSL